MADAPKRPGSNPELDEEEPKSRTGRFNVQHRGGAHVEVGEPINVGGDKPWMCAVKLVGKKRDESAEDEPTQTLLVRTGRGATAEDARREALSQLTLVYGSPVEPPPSPIISQKPSDPPPSSSSSPAAAPPPRTWFARMLDRLRGG
ncbi:MAG: hypothetical protein ABSE49_08880 [Polyangiaceae bacterium]|jgi:hypothetical protein